MQRRVARSLLLALSATVLAACAGEEIYSPSGSTGHVTGLIGRTPNLSAKLSIQAENGQILVPASALMELEDAFKLRRERHGYSIVSRL